MQHCCAAGHFYVGAQPTQLSPRQSTPVLNAPPTKADVATLPYAITTGHLAVEQQPAGDLQSPVLAACGMQ